MTYTLDWSETDLGGSAVVSYAAGAVLDFTDKPSGATAALSLTPKRGDSINVTIVELEIETSGSSVLTFDYKVSSESGFDFLRVDVDGSLQASYSGTVAWTTHAGISIPTAGVHTIRFRYQKDGSGIGGDDRAWVALLNVTNTVTTNDASGSVETYDMEDGAIPSVASTSTWTNSTSGPIAGTRSLRSPTSPVDNGSYDLEVTKPAGTAYETVGFDWKVSTEAGWDKLYVFPDASAGSVPGSGQPSTPGAPGWLEFSGTATGRLAVILPATETTLLLRYAKDAGSAGGSDAVWIDNLAMPATGGGGPIEEAVPTATETDSVIALGRRKTRALPVDTETGAAQTLGRRKRRTSPVTTEADAAQPLGRTKRRAVPTVTETDAAITIARSKRRAVPVTGETDAAIAIGAGSTTVVAVPTVAETDAVTALGRIKRRAVPTVVEADAPVALTRRKRRAVPTTTEAGAALALARRKVRALVAPTEADAATTLVRHKVRSVEIALEADAVGQVRDGSVVIVTPPERTYVVPPETRVLVVAAESRVTTVPPENRTLEA